MSEAVGVSAKMAQWEQDIKGMLNRERELIEKGLKWERVMQRIPKGHGRMTKADIWNNFKIALMVAAEKAINELEDLQENEVIIGELDLTETTEEAIDEDLAELERRNVLFKQF